LILLIWVIVGCDTKNRTKFLDTVIFGISNKNVARGIYGNSAGAEEVPRSFTKGGPFSDKGTVVVSWSENLCGLFE
jgi:hypothetical protein